ncbi:LacI family DNA-binding transcriptional regulator [Pararobbsia silviterrae]|uniref:LacI family transcriptional regulator n=1 Tax=Pararobbsia silviterrae TaxID=1792498 RepID=A0A494X0D9_9BURK|nr:LacI family DNA-binding transcriptional regulator [Pararobbsia silviterrae]RKP44228.1 LacI family transcriptional regulator [Pararobbsia silviterrae]
MATIKDVAARAGVSFTTVSHVVNNTRPVSSEVRTKVEAAIRELNFVPSAVARSLKARTTSTIGVVVPNNTNPYFAEMSRGIENYCERRGYCVILGNSDDEPEKQRKYLRVMLERRIDGLIVASAGDENTLADALGRASLPVVIVDREVPGVEADLVQIDHEQGAYMAAHHLIELGHRRIACISGPAQMVVSEARFRGFRRALEEQGLAVDAHQVIASDYTSHGGYEAAVALLGGGRPSAIFATNDMMALGVLRAAAERGLSVPRDLSVIGFDDIELSRYFYPALTTVGQSIVMLGERAAQTLIERVTKSVEADPQRLIIAPELKIRESTGAPPAA